MRRTWKGQFNWFDYSGAAKEWWDFLKQVPVSSFKVDPKMKISKIDDLGNGEATLILEESQNHFLVFMRLDIDLEGNNASRQISLAQIEPVYIPDQDGCEDARTEGNTVTDI